MSTKAMAKLRASLDIECPYCGHEFDLFAGDDEGFFIEPIFKGNWDQLRGEEVECSVCKNEFTIEDVEW